MADRLWRAQVTLPLDSGIPEDAIVNTFHFDDDDDPIADPEDTALWITNLLDAFYTAVAPTLAQTLTGVGNVSMYDMADPLPRVPVATSTISFTTSSNPPLPNEVALCLSYRADYASGVPAARRRGRIFLGPMSATQSEVVNSQVRPNLYTRTTIADAAAALADGFEHTASPGYRLRWSHYSPTADAGGATLGEAFNDVVAGWVDDAYDTQRRRGAAPTTRLAWS